MDCVNELSTKLALWLTKVVVSPTLTMNGIEISSTMMNFNRKLYIRI